jgi:hypothetical protein
MMTRLIAPGVVFLIFAAVLAACIPLGTILLTRAPAASSARTIILAATGDTAASAGEAQSLALALQNRVDRSAASTFCKGVYEGEISGQPVVIVTTGAGSENAGPCMQELLHQYGVPIK